MGLLTNLVKLFEGHMAAGGLGPTGIGQQLAAPLSAGSQHGPVPYKGQTPGQQCSSPNLRGGEFNPGMIPMQTGGSFTQRAQPANSYAAAYQGGSQGNDQRLQPTAPGPGLLVHLAGVQPAQPQQQL